ncbi:MAG: winged helix DNA-binding domain-containing protein [Proteobacteria bacterium]|nr:winged helix DNA-binding domain-containing protein [Pseudomonadota bacterium]
MQNLTKQQARKLIVLCNDFHRDKKQKSIDATIESFNTLGYVQIDTISVVNRAHLHVLWSRNHHFNQSHLDKMFEDRNIFEYWSHAAAMLPIKDYKYSLFRKQQIANGDRHWYKRSPELIEMMAQVKAIIAKEGAKKSSDFKYKRETKSEWWDWKPAKLALEQLYMQGELMVRNRQGFQKVYDLTENIVSSKAIQSVPTEDEFCRHLIKRYLFAQGIGTAENIAYLRKGLKPIVTNCLLQMFEEGQLKKVCVNKQEYYALPERLTLLDNRLQTKLHILSPFDNMVIQRKRLKELFDYDYQIECYVPAAKRRFGYFCLPILFGNELVGRVDCKAHRKQRVLKVNALFQEKKIKNKDKYQVKLQQALIEFATFNQCDEVVYCCNTTVKTEH